MAIYLVVLFLPLRRLWCRRSRLVGHRHFRDLILNEIAIDRVFHSYLVVTRIRHPLLVPVVEYLLRPRLRHHNLDRPGISSANGKCYFE